jgi:drug/metabolite transporter superfamily protein YnfA
VPRQSDDRSDTIWSAEERVWALVVAAVLLGVEAVLDRALGGTTVGKVLAPLVGVGIFSCLWIAVVGRASNDP